MSTIKYNPNPTTHHIGELAYVDSYLGLLPCKTLKLLPDNSVKVKYTTNRGRMYGDSYYPTWLVIPRSKVHIRNCHYMVCTKYIWTC